MSVIFKLRSFFQVCDLEQLYFCQFWLSVVSAVQQAGGAVVVVYMSWFGEGKENPPCFPGLVPKTPQRTVGLLPLATQDSTVLACFRLPSGFWLPYTAVWARLALLPATQG